ncbi:MAG TPA: ABC transporter permease [Candidatus Tyrphobacter sp.]
MRRVFAQARKEVTEIIRDPLTLTLALLLPAFLLLLMGTAISLTVTELPIVVQNLDGSLESMRFVDAFRASQTFQVVPWPVSEQPERALSSNAARAVLIIPPHFGRDLLRGANAPVQMLIDASDPNTAQLTAGYAAEIVRAYDVNLAPAGRAPAVLAAIRLWFNPGVDSKKFYGPGMFVLGLTLFPTLLAALAMAKEGEDKTILQVYVSSISAHEFLLGKILAIMFVSACESAILITLLLTYFGVSFAGDPTPFIVASILYAFCVAAFGTMIGAAIPNQVAAVQAVALGGFLLVFILSGLLFPIDNIPVGLRWLSNFVWGTYYIEVVRDAFLQGGGWSAMWTKVLAIAAIGSAFYGIAWRNMRSMQLKS